MSTRAFVCGCSGPTLSDAERRFIREARPWGLILFKRNIDTPEQTAHLVDDFRVEVGRGDAPVLIDQEGGRVRRMGPPHWPAYPAARVFERLSADAGLDSVAAIGLNSRLIAADLRAVGINVDCLPVLDVPVPGSHAVIGDRAYADDPHKVAVYGRAAAEGLLAGNVLPVIKHIPGHGRARVDSHLHLPVVDTDRATLSRIDFVPFRELRDMPVAMTAHVVYTAIDPQRPATTSPIVLDQVVRGEIGFRGLLLSDDLSMQALEGSLGDRATAAMAAGVDIALHCNGDLDEARQVAAVVPVLDGAAAERAAAAQARIRRPVQSFDAVATRAMLDAALAMPA